MKQIATIIADICVDTDGAVSHQKEIHEILALSIRKGAKKIHELTGKDARITFIDVTDGELC